MKVLLSAPLPSKRYFYLHLYPLKVLLSTPLSTLWKSSYLLLSLCSESPPIYSSLYALKVLLSTPLSTLWKSSYLLLSLRSESPPIYHALYTLKVLLSTPLFTLWKYSYLLLSLRSESTPIYNSSSPYMKVLICIYVCISVFILHILLY